MNDIPLIQKADINSINTSIIAIKKQLKQLNEALGLVDVPSIDTSVFVKKSDVVDVVQSDNMNPVTSNAVAEVADSLEPVDTVTSGNMQSVTSNAVSLSQSYLTDVEIKTGEKFKTATTEYDVYSKQFRMLSSSYTDNGNRRMFEFDFTLSSNTNIFIGSSGYVLINAPSNISVYRRRWDMRSVVVSTSFQITFATAVHYSEDTKKVNVRIYFDKTVYAVTGIDGYIRLKYVKRAS